MIAIFNIWTAACVDEELYFVSYGPQNRIGSSEWRIQEQISTSEEKKISLM